MDRRHFLGLLLALPFVPKLFKEPDMVWYLMEYERDPITGEVILVSRPISKSQYLSWLNGDGREDEKGSYTSLITPACQALSSLAIL